MAVGGGDGSIILTTKIDESGLNKGFSSIKSGVAKFGKAFAVVGAAGAAAFVGVTKAAVDSYAEYEQLVGGVETLFKDSSKTLIGYADRAYQTAGLSANEYMSTVTSFSASLLQSLGGDTEKAANYADQAIIDMADNANKMGTSMESIQNAYQGFAKQNYTMLDNLKLGYGGTKEEMQRLLKDAEKLTGTKFDISNFSDITQAIHAIQTEMGITGTTAEEASETIQGSANAMKAAWQNLLTGMADSNADVDKLMGEFAESIETFLDNLAPVVEKTIKNLPYLVTKSGKKLINAIPRMIDSFAPEVLNSVVSLIKAIVNTIANKASMIGATVANMFGIVVTSIIELIPQMVTAGIQLISGLIRGLQSQYPILTTAVMTIGAILASLKAVEVVQGIISGFQAIQTAVTAYTAACAASQSVSILLASTMTPLQLAIGVLTGQVSLATAAQVAWNAVRALDPTVLITAAVVGLTAAVVGSVMAYDSYISKHSEVVVATQAMADAAEQAAEKAQRLNSSLDEFNSKTEDIIANAEAEAYSNTVLADELYNLASQTELTADQKARMQVIIDDLNGSVAGLNLKWDENAGSLNLSREALQEYIDKSYEMAQARAAQELMVDTLKTQYKAQLDAQESSKALKQATDELESVYSEVAWTYKDVNGEVVAYAGATREQQKAIDNLNNSIQGYKEALDTSNTTISECESRMQALRNAAGQTGESFGAVGQSAQSSAIGVQGLNSTAGTELPKAFDMAKTSADTSFKGVTQSAVSSFDSVKSSAGSVAASAPGLGGDFGIGYANGIRSRKQDAWAAGFELGMAAKQGTKTAQNSNSPAKESYKLGVDFDNGYILGIQSETSKVREVAGSLAECVLNSISTLLRITRYSMLSYKIGKTIPKGLAMGIDAAKNLVTKATSTMLNDTRSEVQKVLDEENEDILESERLFADESLRITQEREDAEWEEKIKNAKDAAEVEKIKNDRILEQQRRAEDAYLDGLEETAKKERRIHEARQKDIKNTQDNIVDTYKTTAEEILDSIEELQNSQEKLADKLMDYGDVMEEVTEVENKYNKVHSALTKDDDRYVLNNVQSQTRNLEAYEKNMLGLRDREGMSSELFDVIKNMGYEESFAYAQKLMKMNDKQFERYIADWKNNQEVSKRITDELFGEDGDTTVGAKKILSDVTAQSDTLEQYYSSLDAISKRAEVPQEFFASLRDMGVDEGLEYANALLELSDADFKKYIEGWQRKQEASQNISKALYASEAETLSGEIETKFEGVKENFFGIGEDSAEIFTDGFISQLKTAVLNIKNAIGGAFVNLLPQITFGVDSVSVPAFATGGIVPHKTVAMIGEQGKEAVLPLESNTGWMDVLAEKLSSKIGSGSSTVVLELDGREFGRAVVEQGSRETRRIGTRLVSV